MRRFGIQGRLYPNLHYIVPRRKEITDFINRVKEGRYIVLFAPRQTGKTTFFRLAVETLTSESSLYFPIQLNFETYRNLSTSDFYDAFWIRVRREIELFLQNSGHVPSGTLTQFLGSVKITNHISMMDFFDQFSRVMRNEGKDPRIVLIIDEFDGIPQAVLNDFLHVLRDIYLSDETRCPHSVGIVGVKNLTQLHYYRTISPFNIQDEFYLPNFTLQQISDLFKQYTDETGQTFSAEVIEAIQKQTAGQPFLVNRLGQILTEELEIPKNEPITMSHFTIALSHLLEEDNVNIRHLLTNIRENPHFEDVLMRIVSFQRGVQFNLRNDTISQLATYGVIGKSTDGMCEIVNPIYQHCILQAFQPIVNGLEGDYFPENTDFADYLTSDGKLQMSPLLDNFKDFIARAGFKILNVQETPHEFVGLYLLYTYLDQFIRTVHGNMYLEVQTGRGRIDILILHNNRKYIVETKIWEGTRRYEAGKKQLAAYLKSEDAVEGYYVVFDHRNNPEPILETARVDNYIIRSYVIPVIQKQPTSN